MKASNSTLNVCVGNKMQLNIFILVSCGIQWIALEKTGNPVLHKVAWRWNQTDVYVKWPGMLNEIRKG